MPKHHKYLNDIGIESDDISIFNTCHKDESGRDKKFKKQRSKYGFDARETWNLDYTLITWLYSHLLMFLEQGGQIVDFKSDLHKFKIQTCQGDKIAEQEVTLYDAIKQAIAYFETYLKDDNAFINDDLKYAYAQLGLNIVSIIFSALWW